MKKALMLLVMALFVMTTAVGCGRNEPEQPTVNVQATVDAAVVATAEAAAAQQAAIDAAVQATATAIALEAAAVPTPTPVVVTEVVTQTEVVTETEVVTVVDTQVVTTTEVVYVPQEVYVTMSEEELAALIDESVEQAVAATDSYAAAAEQAAADDVVTQSEVETIEAYVELTDETLAYIEDLLMVYAELYGANSEEMILILQEIEQDLEVIAASSASMAASLEEIAYTLDAGLALAEETIAQLENAAANAASVADLSVDDMDELMSDLYQLAQLANSLQNAPQDVTDLLWLLENTPPSAVANTQVEAILSLMGYADIVEGAINDGTLSPEELAAIAQAGVNATASLNSVNVSQLMGLAGAVNGVNQALAAGDINAAVAGLQGLKGSIPSLQGNVPNVQPPNVNVPSVNVPSVQPPSINVPAPGGRKR